MQVEEEFNKRFLCDIPEHFVMSDHQFKHEIQGQLPKHIIQFATDMFALGTLNGLDKAKQEIYKVETLRHADEVHCGCLVVLRDNLSKINEEKEKLK